MRRTDYHIKSSAMFYALFLLSVVSIIIGGLFQLSSLNQQLEFKLELESILANNSKSGLVYAKAYFQELPLNQNTTIRLFNKGIDSVVISKRNWGAYQIISSKAIHQSKQITKIGLVGSQSQTVPPNLYLADQGRPLSLCGKTKLEGQFELPKSGVKRAYIAGQNYQGNKLLYGSKTDSEKQLPEINDELILNLVTVPKSEWNSGVEEMVVPFDSVAVHLFSTQPIYINSQSFKGQIIIESEDSIIVSANAVLQDIILKSPKISIEENFKGNVQCIASETIMIQNNVILEYPSVLGVIETQNNTISSSINISSHVQIVGSVFLLSETPNFRIPIQLSIKENSIINGFVYCDGQTELKGEIKGSLYTKSFYLKTASSAYQNHLLNATISNNLPVDFIPIPLLNESDNIKTIKWLN